jgi:hypothetical protein
MNKFSIDYAEYHIAGMLQKDFSKKNHFSINIPLSRQQKDYDLILHSGISRKSLTIQIKSSRTYIDTAIVPGSGLFHYYAWFNTFKISPYCDFYFCYMSYPLFDPITFRPKAAFDTKILVFNNAEMSNIINNIKTKKGTVERFFGFGFNISGSNIYGTRGFLGSPAPNFSGHLYSKKLPTLKKLI